MTNRYRKDFPILQTKAGDLPLVYFDNAATAQKPQEVINAISDYYTQSNANVHRGIHYLSEKATELYEQARKKVANFIGAKSPQEIIFVRNTTEAINLVAQTYGEENIESGDEIVAGIAEHHANFVPWQQLAKEKGAKFVILDVDKDGRIPKTELQSKINPKTRIVALTQISNVLGIVNHVTEISTLIHDSNPSALTVIDGSQALPHFPVDVQKMGVDFFAFTGHKMFGPMGIGVLWGREELLEKMPPFLFGGGMIKSVTVEKTEFGDLPERFEAGTPDVAGAVGLQAAISYIESVGFDKIIKIENSLTERLLATLKDIPEVTIFGSMLAKEKIPLVCFSVNNIHPHDLSLFLDKKFGVAVRAGHHCAMPLHQKLGIPATVRASLAFYNTEEEIETLGRGIRAAVKFFGSK